MVAVYCRDFIMVAPVIRWFGFVASIFTSWWSLLIMPVVDRIVFSWRPYPTMVWAWARYSADVSQTSYSAKLRRCPLLQSTSIHTSSPTLLACEIKFKWHLANMTHGFILLAVSLCFSLMWIRIPIDYSWDLLKSLISHRSLRDSSLVSTYL